jgi:hypothetical protein
MHFRIVPRRRGVAMTLGVALAIAAALPYVNFSGGSC